MSLENNNARNKHADFCKDLAKDVAKKVGVSPELLEVGSRMHDIAHLSNRTSTERALDRLRKKNPDKTDFTPKEIMEEIDREFKDIPKSTDDGSR